MTNIKKIFVVCSLVLTLLVTSSCGQEAISNGERNETSSTTNSITEDSSNTTKYALEEIIIAEKTDKGSIRISYMVNTISEGDANSLINSTYETDEDIKEGTYHKRSNFSDENSWENKKNDIKEFAESANAADVIKKATTDFEFEPFDKRDNDDSSSSDSSEPDTTSKENSEKDSSSEEDKTDSSKKSSDSSSKSDSSVASTTTKKAETTTRQYVYTPPKTTKITNNTTKTTTKTPTKTTTKAQATNYIGKCHACGNGVTSSNCVKLGDGTFYCNACKNAHKCYNCSKVCNSSNGIEAWTPWGTIYQCYSCRPDLKPEPLPKDIKGTDAEARTEAQIVVDLTNKLRASYGFGSLKTDSRLTAAAMARAKELATLYSHTRPNGNSGGTISLEYNRNACPNGENIQMQCSTGYEEGKDIYQAWENSPGHKATMLDKSSTYIGVGIYYVYKNGSKYTYSVQLFLNGI